MNTPIEHQIIKGADGSPLYVLVPYDEYLRSAERPDEEVLLPNEVVKLAVVEDKGVVRAWREHLGLTQKEVAARLGVTQPAYAQMERRKGVPRLATRKRLAQALGVDAEQLRL